VGVIARREAEAKVVSILKTARSLREAGLLDKSRDEAAEALRILPDHTEAKRFLADVLAEIASKRAEATQAAEHKEWMDEGLRLRLAGKLRGAATAYERAQASARPGSTEAAEAAAACLAELFRGQASDAEARGDFELAVELYAKAVARRDDPETRRSLADARGNLEAKRAEDARRAEATRWTARAEGAERSGDITAALGYYREAARQGLDVSSKVSSLERDLARREEAERGQAAYDGAMTRARTLARGRQWNEAIPACEEALRQKPGDREATELLAEAKRHRGPAKTLALDLGGGMAMGLVLVPAGDFMMGSPDSEADRIDNEGPRHRVKIARPFYMGKYETRRDQFTRFVSETRYRTDAEKDGRAYTYDGGEWGHTSAASWRDPGMVQADDHPVTCVSWSDAKAFCDWLGGRTGMVVRLPTEAEWEYACRAGTTTAFHYGDSLGPDQANFNGNFPYGGAPKGAYRQKTVPVGSFAANAWGLHDMHGNLWEWCADWYDSGYYERAPLEYPAGPDDGTSRVLRGGSWNLHGDSCRSAHRGGYPPTYACSLFGFRVVALPAQGE
jgi:formylglycine-generating enzyme required for sulfatase activity